MGIHWDLGAIPGCPKFSILTQGGAPGIFPLLPRFLRLGILGATPHLHLLPNPEISQIPPFEVPGFPLDPGCVPMGFASGGSQLFPAFLWECWAGGCPGVLGMGSGLSGIPRMGFGISVILGMGSEISGALGMGFGISGILGTRSGISGTLGTLWNGIQSLQDSVNPWGGIWDLRECLKWDL